MDTEHIVALNPAEVTNHEFEAGVLFDTIYY